MMVGLIGDIHGYERCQDVIDWINIVEPDFCLQVGDYLSYNVEWPVPVFWIFGNHEHGPIIKRYIEGTWEEPINNHWLMGGIVNIKGINIMSLPGLPNSRLEPGPARYPQNVYDLCIEQANMPVDIFISHGCGYPFWVWVYDKNIAKSKKVNREEQDITELISKVKPQYAVSGHNHRYAFETYDGVSLIRLGAEKIDMFYIIEL